MSRKRNFTLSEAELQVVEMLVVNLSTIYNWCRRWEAEGLAGLVNRPKSGRPRKADATYCQH